MLDEPGWLLDRCYFDASDLILSSVPVDVIFTYLGNTPRKQIFMYAKG